MKKIIFQIMFFLLSFAIHDCCAAKNSNESEIISFYTLKKEHRNKDARSLEYRLIHGSTKNTELNYNFERILKQNGFQLSNYKAKNTTELINYINNLEIGRSRFETACLPVYRNIIVYKTGKDITKIIKICTSCYSNQVLNKDVESSLLMDFSDYDYLEQLFIK